VADDVESQAIWRGVRSRAMAVRGELEAAERLATQGVEFVRQTDAPVMQADALMELAEVLRLAGRSGDAATAAGEAATLYQGKGSAVSAARAAAFTEELAHPAARG